MGFLLPILNWLVGGPIQAFVKSWLDYKTAVATSQEAGFASAAEADQANFATAAASEVQIDALKIQLYGTPVYRFVTLIVGIPVALHFGLIYLDTILASQFLAGRAVLGVPDPPGQYPLYEWLVVSSFFLVHAVTIGTSNVSAWLNKK